MGANSSKPTPSDTQHVFTSETPVRFSPNLIDSLQSSPESDSTRSQDQELHIQSRVTAELTRLHEATSKSLRDLEESISATPNSSNTESQSKSSDHASSSAEGVDLQGKGKDEGDKSGNLSRASVQKEIERLKEKLQQRQLKEDVVNDKGVGKAKDEVVRCLRVHDRRPLDCWKEVEAFRREVGRLEGAFLGRLLE